MRNLHRPVKLSTAITIPALIFFAGTGLAQQMINPENFKKVVNKMVEAYNAGDYEGMRADYGKEMSEAFPAEKSTPFFKELAGIYGKIIKLQSPKLVPPDQAIFPAHFERRGSLDIKIVLNNQDKIIGIWFLPPTPSMPVPTKHATRLSLPFQGEWLVFWGGDTKELNAHHEVPNQKFAFDLLGVDEQMNTHKGEGTKNEDYYAFGKEILAPADGMVTDVIEGVRDNLPGSMNPYSALGNAVVILHKELEVSVLAHFKQGSIRVKRGDKIIRGQVLGLCGNSGNSSEPHLHYHLQNTPIIQDGSGIKCSFEKVKVTRDGKTELKTNYSPVKGDIISPE